MGFTTTFKIQDIKFQKQLEELFYLLNNTDLTATCKYANTKMGNLFTLLISVNRWILN